MPKPMTTPDPALDAALDRLISASAAVVLAEMTLFDIPATQREFAAARAAVVACAAPARVEITDAMVKRAAHALFDNFGVGVPHATTDALNDYFAKTRKVLESALSGEPEDAGS
jgi:hypothetical protein